MVVRLTLYWLVCDIEEVYARLLYSALYFILNYIDIYAGRVVELELKDI